MNNKEQIVRDEYLQIIRKMLSLGKIRISDVYRSVRIIKPELYRIALKTSNQISKQRFLEDMNLLKQDIEECDVHISKHSLSYKHKKALIDILEHFLKRNRFVCGYEFVRLDLRDKKFCSKEYNENTYYEIENNCYSQLITKLIIENKVRISDLSRTLRIEECDFYSYALKADASFSSKRMIEDLTLLCNDIDSITEDSFTKESLKGILYSFIEPIRYFSNDEDMIEFAENMKSKFKLNE